MSEQSSRRARLVLGEGDQARVFELTGTNCTIGRSELADIVITDDRASRSHATIGLFGGRFAVRDLGSANGTALNDRVVTQDWLTHGDVIRIGRTQFRFEEASPISLAKPTLRGEVEDDGDADRFKSLVHHSEHPCLVLSLGDQTVEYPLKGELLTIGRDPVCDVVIDTDMVSRRHAQVERRGRAFLLRDAGSSNGTVVNRARITQHVLQDGDLIRMGDAVMVFKAAFSPERLTVAEGARERGTRRPVVFVPGFMGSELYRGSERLWPSMPLLFREPEKLFYRPEEPLEPRKVLGELVVIPKFLTLDQYNRLGNYLEEGVGYRRERDLMEFAYDWRQDVRISARQLGAAIEAWQERSDAARGPITIIAHSLGTLVSRYFVEVLGGSAKVERLILLGGPHFGVPHIAGALAAGPQIPIFGGLSRKLREGILTFPSTFQFLPTYPCVHTGGGQKRCPLDDDHWLPAASKGFLKEARHFRNELGTRFTVPTVCIFGYGMKTTSGISVEGDGAGEWTSVEWQTDLAGDGSVPKLSAVLPNTEIHPVKQAHGALYTDPDVRARLLLELTRERDLA